MNCGKFRGLIDEYTLDSVPSERRREFDEHLASCKDCKSVFEDARLLLDALKLQPEPLADAEWEAVERRTLTRLRAELAAPTRESLVSRVAEFLTPVLRPRPGLVFALASAVVIVFVSVVSLVWLQSSRERLASGDSQLQPLWTDDVQTGLQGAGQIASLMTGVERILSEEPRADASETEADTALDAIAQETGLGDLDADTIDRQMYQYYEAWAVNGGYYSDILDASREEVESAIQATSGGNENGSQLTDA